jgi:hypothetical protein
MFECKLNQIQESRVVVASTARHLKLKGTFVIK